VRVLIVNPHMFIYGGAELVIVKLANYLSANGIAHALLTTNIIPEIESDLKNTEIIKFPFEVRNNWSDLVKNIWLLNKGIRRNIDRFDVINVHNAPAELAALTSSKPVVWLCNEPPEVLLGGSAHKEGLLKRFAKNTFYGFDKQIVKRYIKNVVVADEFNALRFKNLYGIEPEIIPYGINYDFFSIPPESPPRRADSRFTVLHAGIINPLKNQLASLKAINILRKDIPEILLILAGHQEANYYAEVKEYIALHRLKRYVEFTGHITRDRLRELFYTSDALLHPIKSQGGWLTPFEAMSAALPIVVSRDMTAASIVEREGIGTVTDNYSEAILDIYKNPDKYKEQGSRGKRYVKNNLTWNNFSSSMVKAFEKACKR
jgi:glycosyltransferase involved in cell wall biosynthesis